MLEGLVRALQFDEDEAAHLADLVHATGSGRPQRRRTSTNRVRPAVRLVLDSIAGPALVRNDRFDLLALNTLGRALYSPVLDFASKRPNTARFMFLSPQAADFFLDWDAIADVPAALGRAQRAHPPGRIEALRPPGGRRADPELREPPVGRRPGPQRDDLHSRAGLSVAGAAGPAGELGADPCHQQQRQLSGAGPAAADVSRSRGPYKIRG